jgi:hypothetical protein
VKTQGAVLKPKKRHVETLTRLPTKRMATACWDFIVAKSTPPEPAPMLDFSSLQGANMDFHPQVMHKDLWMAWGYFSELLFSLLPDSKTPKKREILPLDLLNPEGDNM